MPMMIGPLSPPLDELLLLLLLLLPPPHAATPAASSPAVVTHAATRARVRHRFFASMSPPGFDTADFLADRPAPSAAALVHIHVERLNAPPPRRRPAAIR